MLKAKELKNKSKDELEKMLEEERVKVRDIRFRLAGARLKNFSELKLRRRNIARLLTILKGISLNKTIRTNPNSS
jgi:ribosomal protein L29